MADASQMPLTSAEWIPLINVLSLYAAGIDHPLYIHEVPSWGSAQKIARALRVELLGEPGANDSLLDMLKLQVPAEVTIESVTWIRSRRALFFETNIRDKRNMKRFMTLAAVPSEDAALNALCVLNLPMPLVVDNSKSILEAVAELHASGKSEREISAETGCDPDTVRRNIDAFKRYQAHRLEEEKVRQSDKPKPPKG